LSYSIFSYYFSPLFAVRRSSWVKYVNFNKPPSLLEASANGSGLAEKEEKEE
jgi:hypothetical protein